MAHLILSFLNNRTNDLHNSSELPSENYLLQQPGAFGSEYRLFTFYVCLTSVWLLLNLPLSVKLPGSAQARALTEILILNTTLIICLPVAILFNSALSLVRLCIRIYFKYGTKGRFLLMKSEDALWAQESRAQSCNFNCLYVLEGDCNLGVIRGKFQKLVENPKYDRLRRTVVQKFGFFAWERQNVIDINQHVKYLSGHRGVATEDQVFDRFSEFGDDIFEQDKPPWEVLVVPEYEYTTKFPEPAANNGGRRKKYYALVFRIHHGLMDGISAGQTIRNEIMDGKVELAVDPCAPLKITRSQKIGLYAQFFATSVRNVMKSLLLMESNCFHTGQQLTGPKTFRWSNKIDLNSLKELRARTGVTTTGILLSAFGLALKNLAVSKGLELPDEIHAGSTVAMLPYADTSPRNGFILAHLPIKIGRRSRIENLREVQRATKDLSTSSDLIMNKFLAWLVGRWPAGVANVFLRLVHGTVLVSNVPGFKGNCSMFGDKLVDAVGWAPVKGTTGIGMCLFSYAGKVRAAMVADKVSFPKKQDVEELISNFEREIESLIREGVCRGGG